MAPKPRNASSSEYQALDDTKNHTASTCAATITYEHMAASMSQRA